MNAGFRAHQANPGPPLFFSVGESRSLHLLGKHSTIGLNPQAQGIVKTLRQKCPLQIGPTGIWRARGAIVLHLFPLLNLKQGFFRLSRLGCKLTLLPKHDLEFAILLPQPYTTQSWWTCVTRPGLSTDYSCLLFTPCICVREEGSVPWCMCRGERSAYSH